MISLSLSPPDWTSTGLLGFGMLSHHRVLTSHLPTIPLEGGCYCTFGTTFYLTSHLIPHVHSTTSVHAPHVTFNDHLSSIYLSSILILLLLLFFCFGCNTCCCSPSVFYGNPVFIMYMPSPVLYCKVLNNNNNNNNN